MRVTFRTFALACVQTWSLMAKDHASHAERTSTPEDLTLRQLQVMCSAAPLRPICSPRWPCMTGIGAHAWPCSLKQGRLLTMLRDACHSNQPSPQSFVVLANKLQLDLSQSPTILIIYLQSHTRHCRRPSSHACVRYSRGRLCVVAEVARLTIIRPARSTNGRPSS